MKTVLILVVRAYRAVLGPLLGGACRFHPSCSHYAIEAIERHGAGRGAWLAAKRLLRCRPFAMGGYDPVPDEIPALRSIEPSPAPARSLKAAPLERAQ